MHSINKLKQKAGLTLVEIIVSAVLLALIGAGMFSITLSSSKIIQRAQRRHFADEVAQTVLENFRAYLRADEWYCATSPIAANGAWSAWYDMDYANNFLNIYSTFGTTEFATKYNGKWRYRITDPGGGYEYRKAEVEVDWTEPTL